MRFTKRNLRMVQIPGLMLLAFLALTGSVFAQGAINGTVSNSDLSTPADGDMTFIGFLDDTDEEIRLVSSVGAGYESGHWFDDFQNYQTEAAGNPYDYLFYNTVNGEGFQLSGAIPNNSFETQDITLAPVSWPAAPTGLGGVTVSSSTVVLTWDAVAGVSWHVYRREATSNGSFFRIDDPTGSLTNTGVTTNYYVDNTVDGVLSYTYVLIADDGAGGLSPVSTTVTVNSAAADSPVLAGIDPTSGTSDGGTVVTVTGSGFDPAGATVTFGATPATATVVSPFEMTVTTPAGTIGAAVDVAVTNTASGLASNTLTGGFTYNPNAAPVLAAIGAQEIIEGVELSFAVNATDVDGDTPVLTTSAPLPGTAQFVDNTDGSGSFTWTPSFTEAGSYDVTFYATDAIDPLLVDSEVVTITVTEAGNQTPVLAPVNDTTVAEGASLVLAISATDADGEIPGLSASGPEGALLPTNASFVDGTDGTGTFTFNPDFGQAGDYTIVFQAVDAAFDADSVVVQITVTEVNQMPELAAIGAQGGTEDVLLSFTVNATDADGTTPILTTSTLPGTATFVDSLNGVGLFEWTPGFTDAGDYSVTFYATDADVSTDIDSEIVVITIADAGNQAPALVDIPTPVQVAEGVTLNFNITAADPDGTIPTLTAENLPATNAVFVDSANGVGNFDFTPDFTQAGIYTVTFIASDGVLADSQDVEIEVTDGGNVAPVITPPGDFAVDEGGTLQITVTADDPDDVAAPSLSVNTTLSNYTFTDNGDGTGLLTYTPDYFDAGEDTVVFFATDFGTPQQTASETSVVTTADINQAPVWDTVGPYTAAVDDSLIFTVVATDSTDPNAAHRLFLSIVGTPPANSDFVDNGDGTGTFSMLPSITQVGTFTVNFLAADQGVPQASASLPVEITVVAENNAPVLDSIPPQTVVEGEPLVINVSATDADGVVPTLFVADGPPGHTFVDNGDGTGVFDWTPQFVGGTRLEAVEFRAFDGITMTRQIVLIQINDAGNQSPVFDLFPETDTITEGNQLVVTVGASDPDGGDIILVVVDSTLPANATFVDNGDGTGTITFDPDYSQQGPHTITLVAYDGPVDDPNTLSTEYDVTITVQDAGNQVPTLEPIGNRAVQESSTLDISIVANDPDGTFPTMTITGLMDNATFTDNGDGTADFSFTPDLTQAGLYTVTFTADDGEFTAEETIEITVVDNNQLPFVITEPGSTIYEADTLIYTVQSYDGDGTTPYLSATLSEQEVLADNMEFTDNRDGTGTLVFTPDYTQGGPELTPVRYNVVFSATDEDYPGVSQTSETVVFRVIDRNQPPEMQFSDGTGPFTINEGETLSFGVIVFDGDAVLPPSLTVLNMPDSNASFSVTGNSGNFSFTPDFTQAGSYLLTFIAVDQAAAADSQDISIEVIDAGNQSPQFSRKDLPDTMHVPVGHELAIEVAPYDPDADSISLEAFPILPGATFTDHGDGTGTYYLVADSTYLNQLLEITFVVTDHPSLATDTLVTRSLVLPFVRGDIDGNGYYNINDVSYLISYLYRQGPPPVIMEAANVDGDSEGRISLGDITFLIYFLWYHGPQPPQ